MAALELCTAADVYRRVGGQPALAQLIDPASTGTWDATTLTLAIQDASNLVASAAGVQSQLAGYTQAEYQERFPELVTLASQKALGLVWIYGTSGRAMPPGIESINTLADAELERLRTRRSKHGAVDFSPSPAHRIAQVDIDPDNSRMSLASWKAGFC